MLYDALKESEIDFAVDRWTAVASANGRAHYAWQPVGLFKGCTVDAAIEKAAIAINRPALLRATPIEELPLPNNKVLGQLGFEFP